jgi:Fe-S oxidoreductase
MIVQIIFLIILIAAIALFTRNVKRIRRNILLGRDIKIEGNKSTRWQNVFRVALGQSKMVKRPIAGFLHVIVYVGFVIINIEVLEILIDGIFGTHRILAKIIPDWSYNFLIGGFEILAIGVWIACVIFLIRRNIVKVPRVSDINELKGFPFRDANIILMTEVFLMTAFLTMNTCDGILQSRNYTHYFTAGAFPISSFLRPMLSQLSSANLEIIERTAWWAHILGILAFLNYLVISKHFHIILSFPNVYYSKIIPQAEFNTLENITREVKLMLDPNANVPEAIPGQKFGAKDIFDLNWLQLMNAYSCTECGRCTSVCPANQTGKKLSPRKIMMDTRDRLEEIGRNMDQHGKDFRDEKSLLHDYISQEEIMACTTCNACVQECPVNIDPLSIIVDLRRFLVMEESKMSNEWTSMNSNIETNGAPWKFAAHDRMNWAEGLEIPTMADVQAKGEEAEILFWVGCAGSFDDRYKSVTRSFAKILKEANVKFAVLGMEETCNGDPAKRSGNEFLAEMQAMTNIQTLATYGVKKIVTACPHCFNILKNEYPALGGNYEVIHHSAFLSQLLAEGKIKIEEENPLKGKSITYHDSCYIGRGNGIYEAPRNVIESFKADLKEMKKCRANGMCCGAGGAQVFQEEMPGNKRVNVARTEQALETKAEIIASACPFCMTMFEDGIKNKNAEEKIKVKDIAELIAEAKGI